MIPESVRYGILAVFFVFSAVAIIWYVRFRRPYLDSCDKDEADRKRKARPDLKLL